MNPLELVVPFNGGPTHSGRKGGESRASKRSPPETQCTLYYRYAIEPTRSFLSRVDTLEVESNNGAFSSTLVIMTLRSLLVDVSYESP